MDLDVEVWFCDDDDLVNLEIDVDNDNLGNMLYWERLVMVGISDVIFGNSKEGCEIVLVVVKIWWGWSIFVRSFCCCDLGMLFGCFINGWFRLICFDMIRLGSLVVVVWCLIDWMWMFNVEFWL